ncbi:MAG: hypothetical protein H7A38_06360 [Chlamydiales bacterium]|nr:hypothetical protein [Chlamydiales bacterium]
MTSFKPVDNGLRMAMMGITQEMVTNTIADQTAAENVNLVAKENTEATTAKTNALAPIMKEIEDLDPSSSNASTIMQKYQTDFNFVSTEYQQPIDTINTQSQTDASNLQQIANNNGNLANAASQFMSVMDTLKTILASPF